MAESAFFSSLRDRKVVVLGLPYDVETNGLLEYMSKFGIVDDAIVMKDRGTGNSRGFGYVTFASAQDAKKATSAQHSLNGRRLDVKIATPREEMFPSTTRKVSRIFVARIPLSVTEDTFRSYFEKYGPITDAYMPKDHSSKAHRGIGFVTFESSDSVDQLLGETHELGGSIIAVDRAAPKDDDTAKFWGGLYSYLTTAAQMGAFADMSAPGLANELAQAGLPANIMELITGAAAGANTTSTSAGTTGQGASVDVRHGLSTATEAADNGVGASGQSTSDQVQYPYSGYSAGPGFNAPAPGYASSAVASTVSNVEGSTLASSANPQVGSTAAYNWSAPNSYPAGAGYSASYGSTPAVYGSSSASTSSYPDYTYGSIGAGYGAGYNSAAPQAPSFSYNPPPPAPSHSASYGSSLSTGASMPSPAGYSYKPQSSVSGKGNKIFIGRLPMDATTEHIRTYFSQYGRILDVYVPKDPKKREGHRGFGFVTFFDDGVAERVSDLSHEILGQPVAVDRPTPIGGQSASTSSQSMNASAQPYTSATGAGGGYMQGNSGNYGGMPGASNYNPGWGSAYGSGGGGGAYGPTDSGDGNGYRAQSDFRYKPY